MPDEPVSVVCPHCNVKLKLKDSSALGTRIKCPKCQTAFIAAAAPSPAVAAAGASPASKKRPPADAPPEDEGDDEEAEQPKKKKKKKKKKKEKSGAPMGLIIGISAFVFLLVAGGVVAMVVMAKGGGGSRGAPIDAPQLAEANAQSFTILAPKDWKSESGGKENSYWVEFVNGPIQIKARDDTSGVGDIMSGPNRSERHDDHTLDTVHHVHLGKGETLKDELDNYSELEPVRFDGKVGNGRWSEFSYTEGMLFSTKMKGIRATVQGATKTFVVRCTCPEKYWETFKPIFIQIATSVGAGRRL